jgi:hypothetical protein
MGTKNETSTDSRNIEENNNNNNNENNFSNSNINLMMEMKDEYPDHFPEPIKKLGNNVIYYDQHFNKRTSEIYRDAEMFKIYTNGAFILVTNKYALFLVLKEIVLLKTNCKFDLICTGSSCKEILEYIQKKNFLHIFKRCCIYTYNPDKYSDILNKYSLVKDIFFDKSQVLDFLEGERNSTPILRTLNLVTLYDYENNVKKIHFLVAKYYNNFSDSNYNEAIKKVINFMDNPGEYKFRILNDEGEQLNQKETMLNTLKLYEDIENNYKIIIKNYTKERCSVYKDFNYLLLRLNEKGIDAFGYFIAGLIYSLNKFNKEGFGETKNRLFYRGMRLDMTEILNYERYEGNILCFPSFTSASTILNIAAKTERYGGREVEIPTREKEGLFSVILTIKHNFSEGAVPNAINIESISNYQSESECLFLPFSFFLVKSVKINLKEFQCDIEMENISRKSILEEKIKNGGQLNFLEDYIHSI